MLANVYVNFALIAVSLIYAAVAIRKAGQQKKAPNDDALTTSATRGDRIPLVLGRQKLGGYMLWIMDGPPEVVPARSSGKGFGNQVSQNGEEYQAYMAIGLSANPGKALYGIYQNNERVLDVAITPDNTPSGSAVLTDIGTIYVFWGESNQQVPGGFAANQTHLNAPNATYEDLNGAIQQLQTAWPNLFWVLWAPISLGGARVAPRLEYDFEGALTVPLKGSEPYIPAEYNDDDDILQYQDSPRNLEGEFTYLQVLPNAPTGCFWGHWNRNSYQPLTERFRFRVIRGVGGSSSSTTRYVDISNGEASTGQPFESEDIRPLFKSGTVVRLQDDVDVWNVAPVSTGTLAGSIVPPGVSGHVDISSFGGGRAGLNYQYFVVLRSELVTLNGVAIAGNNWNWGRVCRVYLGPPVDLDQTTIENVPEVDVPGAMALSPLSLTLADGVNPAHMLHQLMFAPWPLGAGLDRDAFDITTLEEVGRQLSLAGEQYRGSLTTQNARDAASALLQDVGLLLSFDPQTGRDKFELLREPSSELVASLSTIPLDLQINSEASIETAQEDTQPAVIGFTFKNQERNFRDDPLMLDNDGKLILEQRSDSEIGEINTTTSEVTAFRIAERRAQEGLSRTSRTKVFASRDVGLLRPGLLTFVEGIDNLLMRVWSIKPEQLTDTYEIDLLVDQYSLGSLGRVLRQSGLAGDMLTGARGTPRLGVSPLALQRILELPRELTPFDSRVVALKVRESKTTAATRLHLSADGTNFEDLGVDPYFQFGGRLAEAVAPEDPLTGVEAVPVGPDLSQVLDLTSDTAGFAAGKQVLVIGTELCLIESVTANADGTIDFGTVTRAVFGTTAVDHSVGDEWFILRPDRVTRFKSVLMIPGEVLYAKVQPGNASAAADLADLETVSITLNPEPVVSSDDADADSAPVDATLNDLILKLKKSGGLR